MAIQIDKAMFLANSTSEEFKKNCKHNFEKEYHLGASTGDESCIICGETRPRK